MAISYGLWKQEFLMRYLSIKKGTVDAMQKAWIEIFSELSKINCKFDDRRPILERYAMQMLNKHYCEICVPIL